MFAQSQTRRSIEGVKQRSNWRNATARPSSSSSPLPHTQLEDETCSQAEKKKRKPEEAYLTGKKNTGGIRMAFVCVYIMEGNRQGGVEGSAQGSSMADWERVSEQSETDGREYVRPMKGLLRGKRQGWCWGAEGQYAETLQNFGNFSDMLESLWYNEASLRWL